MLGLARPLPGRRRRRRRALAARRSVGLGAARPRGRHARGVARARALGSLDAGPLPDGFASLESSLAVLRRRSAGATSARSSPTASARAALEGPDSPWRPVITWALGWAHLCNGDLERADAWLRGVGPDRPGRRPVDRRRRRDRRPLADRGPPRAARRPVAARRGGVAVAGELGLLDAIEDGEVHTARGAALAARGRTEEALAALERGVFLRRLWGQPLDLADGLIELGVGARTGAAAGATFAEAEAVLAGCRDAGALPVRLAAARRAAGLGPAVPALSERELTVLRLLGSGRSEREIGGELYLSFNTVHTHVRRSTASSAPPRAPKRRVTEVNRVKLTYAANLGAMTDYGLCSREIGDRFGVLFDGMRIARSHGTTLLTGPVRDQAHLHGLIERISELGIELVSVNPTKRHEHEHARHHRPRPRLLGHAPHVGGLEGPLRGRAATTSSPPPTPASRSRSRRSTPTPRRSRRSPCRRSSSTWSRSSGRSTPPPIMIGHSAGGVFTQILLDHGFGAAGVAINSAPTEGVPVVPLSQIRSTFPVLKNPANRHRAVGFTPEQWHYAFTNSVQRGGVTAAVPALPHPRVRLDLLGQRAGQHPPGQGRQLGELRERRARAAAVHLRHGRPPDAAEGPALEREALQVRDDHRGRGVRRPAPAARPRRAGRRSPTARSSGRSRTRASGSRERRPDHARRRADRPHRGRPAGGCSPTRRSTRRAGPTGSAGARRRAS